MKALMIVLLAWITQNTDYKVVEPLPEVVEASQDELQRLQVGTVEHQDGREHGLLLNAVYDDENNVIYVLAGRDWSTLRDKETLLHELVHYLQFTNGAVENLPCEARAEEEAYALGKEYLIENGFDDEEVLKNYRILGFFLSRCPRSIHP